MHRTIGAVGVRRLSGGPDVRPAEASGRGRPNAAARSLAKPSVRPSVGHKARLEPRPLNPLGRAHREQQVDRRHWDGEIVR